MTTAPISVSPCISYFIRRVFFEIIIFFLITFKRFVINFCIINWSWIRILVFIFLLDLFITVLNYRLHSLRNRKSSNVITDSIHIIWPCTLSSSSSSTCNRWLLLVLSIVYGNPFYLVGWNYAWSGRSKCWCTEGQVFIGFDEGYFFLENLIEFSFSAFLFFIQNGEPFIL